MIREEFLRRLIDEAFVDLYLSGVDGRRIYWPWRMQPPSEASRSYRNACENYIIDSEPQSPHVGNQDVLDEAVRVDADMVLLADYFPFEVYESELDPEDDPEAWEAYKGVQRECGDAYSASIQSVREGLRLADEHSFDGAVILPLQAPHADAVSELPDHDRYAIGGLKDASASDYRRVDAARAVRDAAPEAWIHGLGWGATEGVVAALHDDPQLLDSVDYSTPMQTSIMDVDAGDERMSVQAARAGARLIEDLRRFSPYLSDPPKLPESEQQPLITDGGRALSSDAVGHQDSGRDADPLREARTITRDVLPKLPRVDYPAARDYAGVHMGLPVQMYADRRPVDPQHVEAHVEQVRDGIRELLKGHAGETAIEDFIRVDVEGTTPGQRARERDISQSTVRTNVRDVKQRLPRVADEWEGL